MKRDVKSEYRLADLNGKPMGCAVGNGCAQTHKGVEKQDE